ncbi:MAG: thioredoxin domain-containing protein [Alphaproteobacteria bacterium]|jgi:protein-disulfide isomerase|nr:thioredoxin domain-containing protein [Alphaproteobacteria bacterium]
MPAHFRNSLLTALLALVFGFLGAAIWSYAGLADNRTRAFLLDNPDMLPKMAEAYQAQQARERLAELGDEVYEPFPGAVLGNPEGSKVLVEFSDYNCGYCEASLADVERLVEEDPDLKVVLRELPQFEGSEAAARMALAAALQGKYAAFHDAMFARGPAGPESAEAVARDIGLDMDRARADMASDAVSVELARNFSMARALGFNGTPAWVTRGTTINGAVGYDRLSEAVREAGTNAEG